MQRTTPLLEGEFFHIYNRGVDKRIIFASEANYRRFMALLYLANSIDMVRIGNILRYDSYEKIFLTQRPKPLVAIGAFCLMPNHFHILATPLVENGLSQFMLKLQTGYSMYFNKLKERSGSLFQGPFQSVHADDDVYLKYLFSYIHLNPAKLQNPDWKAHVNSKSHSLLRFVTEYPYSSLHEYISQNHVITSPEYFPKYFASDTELTSHITDWFHIDLG